jgi:hypothetical protein
MKPERISRRSLGAALAAAVAAPAQAPAPAPATELEQAKERLRKSSEALANVMLDHAVPPAFTFQA